MKAYYKLLLGLITLLSLNNTFGATRYWVGGTGTWDNSSTTNWSASSGGAGGASVPTSSDDVVFDASSGLTGSTVTVGTSAVCNNFTWSATVGTLTVSSDVSVNGDFTWSGAGGTLAGSNFADLNIYGSMTLNASMTISATYLYFYFKSTSTGKTITTNGKTLPYYVYFSGSGGGWTTSGALTCSYGIDCTAGTLSLGGTLTCTTVDVWGGTFTTNNYALTLSSSLECSSGTLNLGSSAIGITTSTAESVINISGGTINAGTSAITINTSSTNYSDAHDIYLGTKTLYNITINSAVKLIRFFDGGTVNNLVFNSGQIVLFENNKTYTVSGTITATGTCTSYISFLTKYNGGSAATLSVGGANSLSFLQVRGITKSGAGSIDCDDCSDVGNNSGIDFTDREYSSRNLYWRSGTSGSWATAANWSTNSDGTSSGNTCLPILEDNIYFNANAITSGGQTITINAPIFCNNIDFTGLTNSPTWANSANDCPMFVSGNYTMTSGMGTFTNEGRVYFCGSGNQLITTAGKYLTNNFVLFYGSGTYYAEDDLYLSSASDILLTKGTLSARNNANTTTYNLYLAGDWRVNDEGLSAGASFTYSTSTVYFIGSYNTDISDDDAVCTFYNVVVNKGSSTYYSEPVSGETVNITGNLTISAGYYYMWSSSSTTNITGNVTISSANTKYQQSNGTTTIAGTLTLGHSSATLPLSGGTFTWNNNSTSGFALNTGTMTVSGATVNIGTTNTHTTSVLNVGNSAGSADVTLTVSSGTLNIADKLYVQSDGILNVTGGTINIKSTTNNIGTATSKWVIDASGEFKQTSGTINVLGAYDNTSSYPAVAFNTSATTTAGNITGGTIVLQSTTTGVTTGYHVNWGGKTIYNLTSSTSGATYTQLTSAVTIKGTKTISSGVTYNANGLAIGVAGNWTNNGTYTHNNNTVTLNGGSAQTIGGTASTTFYGLTINNTSGDVTLGINTTATNALTLTSGKVYTVSYTLTAGTSSSNATVSAGSSTSYVVAYDNAGTKGYLKQFLNSNTAYNFPVGDATNFTPLVFTLSSGTLSSAYIICHTKASTIPGINTPYTTYINRYWEITQSGITSPTYDISYTYVTGDITGTEADLLPVKLSGFTWYKPSGSLFTDGTVQGNGSVDVALNKLTWTGLSTFSLYGGVGNAAVALPTTLYEFNGKNKSQYVSLFWKTFNEINNEYFTLERSIDGINFREISRINGAGNSNSPLLYSYYDYDFHNGINYYKLKQTDFNGTTTDLPTISIDMSKENGYYIKTVNSLGQIVDETCKGIVFDIYSDGTSIKRIQL